MRLAHSLTGVAGNIGARGVQNSAKKLELACQKSSGKLTLEPLLDSLVGQLNAVIAGLDDLKLPDFAEPTGAGGKDVVTLMTELRQLLEDDDTEASTIVEK